MAFLLHRSASSSSAIHLSARCNRRERRAMLDKSQLVEAHQPRWESVSVWLALLATYFALQGLIAWSLLGGPWWLAWLLVVPLAHVMHAHLLAFHEAAHGTLCPRYFWNEAC